MSRGFYRMDLCAFAAHENEGTLIVMVKSITCYIDDLGKSRQATIPKCGMLTKTKPRQSFVYTGGYLSRPCWVSVRP